MGKRMKFSICIPAYNRARHLGPLLGSILAQGRDDFEVVICEDKSPERERIASVVMGFQSKWPGRIFYHENVENLGYDGNIRRLIELASGEYCFFMGNDDLMCEGALDAVASVLDRYGDVGVVLKSYAWFDDVPEKINQTVRYFNEEKYLSAGPQAISVCFRRAGVISGFVVHRDSAQACATDEFDGGLYYQMHLVAGVLVERAAVAVPEVLVLCRNSESPDFGNSKSEQGIYVPGHYTPKARVNMIASVVRILEALKRDRGLDVVDGVLRDYANYFYPYIKDQLNLSLVDYWRLYRAYCQLGFAKYLMFHLYFFLAYILKEKGFDAMTRTVRNWMGRSPHFGRILK